ncbi:hypothetical protein HK096_010063 [Nowakowskiella sp. JEL0078]|nr:hypothetical protein HK096_010063 [Nowakowskiella sp. JEL0078]
MSISKYEFEIQNITSDLFNRNKAITELESQLTVLKNANDRLNLDVESLDTKLKQSEQIIIVKSSQMRNLENDISDRNYTIRDLNNNIDKLQEETEKRKVEIKKLQVQLKSVETSENDYKELEKNFEQKSIELEQIEKEYTESERIKKVAESRAESLVNELREQKSRFRDIELRVKDLESELGLSRTETTTLKEENTLNLEKLHASESIHQTLRDNLAELKTQYSDLKHKLKMSDKVLSKSNTKIEEKLSDNSLCCCDAQQKVKDLQEQLQEQEQRLKDIENIADKNMADCDDEREKHFLAMQENKVLSKSVKKLEKENNRLRAKLEPLKEATNAKPMQAKKSTNEQSNSKKIIEPVHYPIDPTQSALRENELVHATRSATRVKSGVKRSFDQTSDDKELQVKENEQKKSQRRVQSLDASTSSKVVNSSITEKKTENIENEKLTNISNRTRSVTKVISETQVPISDKNEEKKEHHISIMTRSRRKSLQSKSEDQND